MSQNALNPYQITRMGHQIESNSFTIIDQEVGAHDFDPLQWQVVRRIIHSTGDFEFTQLTRFHPDAIEAGVNALAQGAPIIADVKMICAGLNADRLAAHGSQAYSFISDEDVIDAAKDSTRAIESIQKAHRLGLLAGSIVAVGNAPTALLEVLRFIEQEQVKPALIIGVPVGFVSAVESKEAVAAQSVPHIVCRGRKGSSTIAVAIIHALLSLLAQRQQA